MRAAVAFVLSFVASTLAYSIISPSGQNGWTTSGPQNVNWTRVNTDNLNFTALLTNENISGFTSQVLAALVNGTTGFTQLTPQNGGFPTGSGFRLQFVLNSTELHTILAESNEPFDIKDNSSTSSTTTGSTVATSSSTSQTGISGSSGTSDTSPSLIPTSSTGGAASSYPVQIGFLVLLSLLGFALA